MSGSFNPLHEGHRGMLAAGLAARSKKAHSGDRTGLTCQAFCIIGLVVVL